MKQKKSVVQKIYNHGSIDKVAVFRPYPEFTPKVIHRNCGHLRRGGPATHVTHHRREIRRPTDARQLVQNTGFEDKGRELWNRQTG